MQTKISVQATRLAMQEAAEKRTSETARIIPDGADKLDPFDERTSNVDFVTYIMNHSRHGGLKQAFIIEAIRFYSMRVMETPLPESIPDDMVINPRVWHAIAVEVQTEYSKRYNKPEGESNA